MFNTIQEFINYIFSEKWDNSDPLKIQPFPRGKYSLSDLVRFIRSLTEEERNYLFYFDIPNELDRIYYNEHNPCGEDVGVGGEEELELLQSFPFADSIYNILKDILEQTKKTYKDFNLPQEIDTDRARKYFKRAIDIGYMYQVQDGFRWTFGGSRGGKACLGYFIESVYKPTKKERVLYTKISKLFNVNRLESAVYQANSAKKPQPWRSEINKTIFFD